MGAPAKYLLSAALLTCAFVPATSVAYGGADSFFNKTFVVTFDLGPNDQMQAIQYIVEGIAMSPVSCQDGKTSG